MTRSVFVAIPVKNGADYLAEAIESVLSQDGVDLTVHVIDNRSDDDSLEIAQRYAAQDPRLTAERNPVDVFYYGSLNRALAAAEAEYFVPFAHDDVMQPGNLRRKVDALEETGAGFATSTCMQIDERGEFLRFGPDHRETPLLTAAPDFFPRIVPTNDVACQSVVARTAALRAVGGFDGRSFYAGDWLTWMRLSLRWPVVALAEPLTAFRIHEAAGTLSSLRSGIGARDVPSTLDRVFCDEAMPAAWRDGRDRLVAASHLSMARELTHAGLLRIADGWSAYMATGRALALLPADADLRRAYLTAVRAAGLHEPDLPADAVALAPESEAEAGALAATVRQLGVLLGRLTVTVDAERLSAAMALLEPVFGDADLDVAVLPTDDPRPLLTAGCVALAGWGSAFAVVAESAGVPVFPHSIPEPFAGPPDAGRWQTVDSAACLP
ncbi:MAG: glycosyl transferase family 2 [Conexibacter sp.]|nr:glycosyl transferase family 2 [Conexibacter sp.]